MRFHDDPGCYVAHYTQCTTAIDYILASNTLKLGPLSKTNDPRETKVWRFAVGGNSSTHDENIALSRRNTEFDALLKRGCKVLCVSEDAYDAWKTNTSQRAYGKPRMWYQYAENHKGVCLIFDKDALNSRIQQQFEQNTVHSGRIEYGNFHDAAIPGWIQHYEAFQLSADDIAKEGVEAVLKKHGVKYWRELFFRKNADWQDEAEFRWIIFSEDDDPVFVNFETSLRAILLGPDFPPEKMKAVYTYCKSKDVSLSRIVWINGMPGVHWLTPDQLTSSDLQTVREQLGLPSG